MTIVIKMTIIWDMKYKMQKSTVAVLALMLGGAIYILFREGTYIHRTVPFEIGGIWACVSFPLDTFVRFWLCDFLWSYSLCMLMSVLIGDVPAAFMSAGLGAIWEILQLYGIADGTGDIIDCFMYLIGASCAVLTDKIILKGGD